MRGLRAQQLDREPSPTRRAPPPCRGRARSREAGVCLRRCDNSRCWTLLNIRLLDPEPGQVGGTLVSTVIDITERKLWEETVRQSEARFTAFMRHLPESLS